MESKQTLVLHPLPSLSQRERRSEWIGVLIHVERQMAEQRAVGKVTTEQHGNLGGPTKCELLQGAHGLGHSSWAI